MPDEIQLVKPDSAKLFANRYATSLWQKERIRLPRAHESFSKRRVLRSPADVHFFGLKMCEKGLADSLDLLPPCGQSAENRLTPVFASLKFIKLDLDSSDSVTINFGRFANVGVPAAIF